MKLLALVVGLSLVIPALANADVDSPLVKRGLAAYADLDYAGLQKRLAGTSTAVIGHSDFTAIQLALLARAGLVTFGGPMLKGKKAEAESKYSDSSSTFNDSRRSVWSSAAIALTPPGGFDRRRGRCCQ